MKFLRENISWIAPTAAILLVAPAYLATDTLFGSKAERDRVAAFDPQVEQARMAQLNNSVLSALETKVAPTPIPDAQGTPPSPEPAQTAALENDSTDVTRNRPVDLLQVTAPAKTTVPAPETTALDTNAAAEFFAKAQNNLVGQSSCREDLEELASVSRIYFPAGGLSGEDAGLSSARLIGMVLRDCPGFAVQVEGHSDPSGDPRANKILSLKRAEAVVARLAASGIDTADFIPVGYGDERPSTVRGTKDAAYYDRRVEFTVIESAQKASYSVSPQPWQKSEPGCVSDLQPKADLARHFYAARSITAPASEMAAIFELAQDVAACDGARLRVVGHHSDQPGSREDVGTGRLRALAMMSALVSAGFAKDSILIGAPSYSVGIAGQPALPNSRVDFQVVAD
ncbi:OmpA family protein [Sulfitobacter noctilucicola]|uniref:Outer membrane protein OmpA-like peptidoglycan-associated protein n=1 Tax=Sulfitobacter noctilucicola TaxID=1342301 RepID=A0A7W6Q5L5_9RHOB|nr:OmpA family protein [Sulfitobacter noctilucicola]MBB4173932.1 outer membrane protein OmpA-like peptidoglycan-associated protein [Sulfitobacter noctilucicola]